MGSSKTDNVAVCIWLATDMTDPCSSSTSMPIITLSYPFCYRMEHIINTMMMKTSDTKHIALAEAFSEGVMTTDSEFPLLHDHVLMM
jgi:hypothetical protein